MVDLGAEGEVAETVWAQAAGDCREAGAVGGEGGGVGREGAGGGCAEGRGYAMSAEGGAEVAVGRGGVRARGDGGCETSLLGEREDSSFGAG